MTRPDDTPDLSGYDPAVRSERFEAALSNPIAKPTDAEREANDPYYEDPEPTGKQTVSDAVWLVAAVGVIVWALFKVFGS